MVVQVASNIKLKHNMLSIRTLQKKKLLYTEESFGSPRPIRTSSNDNDDSGGRIRRGLQTDGVWLFWKSDVSTWITCSTCSH